jgi:glycosyltransferase involved in cell wall biosynthesis
MLSDGLTVFVPLYNEEAILDENARRLHAYAGRCAMPYEIIFGSNGSTDRTVEIGRALADEFPNIVFFHVAQRGPGQAFAEALRRAKYTRFVCLDADLSFEMTFLDNALRELASHDAVVGSKRLGHQKRPLLRRVASGMFIWLTNLLTGMPYCDYSIGAKAYRTEAVLPFVDRVDRHTFYTQEMLYQLKRRDARIVEIPVDCEDHRQSRFNLLHEGVYRYAKLFRLWLRGMWE